ncbi:MAG: hypothetical protein JSS46_08450 [Proteobacteria bacterium]|jgi:hypothetical protein|nr:hypothetical protein [Pseudomonadota bacterium]
MVVRLGPTARPGNAKFCGLALSDQPDGIRIELIAEPVGFAPRRTLELRVREQERVRDQEEGDDPAH